jgi:signal transduction histidine kinase
VAVRKRSFQKLTGRIGLLSLLAIFTLPLGILVRQLVFEIDQRIEFIEKERRGLHYNRPLRNLLEKTLAYRSQSQDVVAKGKQSIAALVDLETQIESMFQEIEANERQDGKILKTASNWSRIQATWRFNRKALSQNNLSPEELYCLQSGLITDIVKQITHVGDTSNMILDPDLDTYYFLDTLITKLPTAAFLTAEIRDLPQVTCISQEKDPAQHLFLLSSRLDQSILSIARARQTILEQYPEANIPTSSYVTTVQRTRKVVQIVEQLPLDRQINNLELQKESRYSLDAQFLLYDAIKPLVQEKLSLRVDQLKTRKSSAVIFTFLVLFIIISIYIALTLNWLYIRLLDRRLSLQYRTASVLAEAQNLAWAIDRILPNICQQLQWDIGELWQVEHRHGEINLSCVKNWQRSPDPLLGKRIDLPLDKPSIVSRAFSQKQPIWRSEVMQYRNALIYTAQAEFHEFPHALALPILHEDEVIGVMAFFNHELPDQSEEHLTTLLSVGRQIAQFIQRQKVSRELSDAKEVAEVASRTKSQFLANMSHEFRTPLNAIIGYGEMLHEESEDFENTILTDDLNKIVTAGRHLLKLVEDVLDISKIEAGHMQPYLEEFNISLMLEEVVATIKPLIQKNKNVFVLKCDPDVINICSDFLKLKQILINLLSNAGKFTHSGLVQLEVTREVQAGQAFILFHVKDSGIGISPEQIQKLFRVFTQADASTTRKYGGTGLGLAISQAFCDLMGGTLTVDSAIDRGSVFTVRIPERPIAESPTMPIPEVSHG